MRELVPSADIPHDPATALEFPSAAIDMETLRIDRRGPGGVARRVLDETNTDGIVIVHRGRIGLGRLCYPS